MLPSAVVRARLVVDSTGLEQLLGLLREAGYRVLGPTVRDRSIVLDEIRSVSELPRGWTDDQEPGSYRLRRREDGAYFGWAVGPHVWRQFLFPPRTRLWRAERSDDGFDVVIDDPSSEPPLAFVGVRSCDLHAIAIQDRVFIGGGPTDPLYAHRRQGCFVVAVHCSDPATTCFCSSMRAGPRAEGGYDLALTELLGPPHEFLLEAATEKAVALLDGIDGRPSTPEDIAASLEVTAQAARRMSRRVETEGIAELLASNLDHPRWDEVAERCLACTNCTLVCPTCFCSSVEDVTDLTGAEAERWRRWDSCFTLDHSYLNGASVRGTHRDRYRQWLTHKLGTWIEQFGSSGCVGCGRCITWCPVGIDLTEEVAAIWAEPTQEPDPAEVAMPVREGRG